MAGKSQVPDFRAPLEPQVPGARRMEFGIYTFVDHTPDPATGERITAAQRHANLLEEAELADRLGLDVFGVGEHHREDFIASAPSVVLAAIAARTKRIRLTSAVTVLSSEDPVRVFQQYATLDLLSNGRAELMAGRGSFTESFPLFGFDLKDYNTLYAENLDPLRDEPSRLREALELNNKIRTMQRQAYGYRDQEFFILKLLALHESKYALVG